MVPDDLVRPLPFRFLDLLEVPEDLLDLFPVTGGCFRRTIPLRDTRSGNLRRTVLVASLEVLDDPFDLLVSFLGVPLDLYPTYLGVDDFEAFSTLPRLLKS